MNSNIMEGQKLKALSIPINKSTQKESRNDHREPKIIEVPNSNTKKGYIVGGGDQHHHSFKDQDSDEVFFERKERITAEIGEFVRQPKPIRRAAIGHEKFTKVIDKKSFNIYTQRDPNDSYDTRSLTRNNSGGFSGTHDANMNLHNPNYGDAVNIDHQGRPTIKITRKTQAEHLGNSEVPEFLNHQPHRVDKLPKASKANNSDFQNLLESTPGATVSNNGVSNNRHGSTIDPRNFDQGDLRYFNLTSKDEKLISGNFCFPLKNSIDKKRLVMKDQSSKMQMDWPKLQPTPPEQSLTNLIGYTEMSPSRTFYPAKTTGRESKARVQLKAQIFEKK
jgi:hypothetical protein